MDSAGDHATAKTKVKYFISYRSPDLALAKRVAESLCRLRLAESRQAIFDYDDDIKYTSPDFQYAIDTALHDCERVIALVTPNFFVNSEYTERELNTARLFKKLGILKVDKADLKASWATHNYVELASRCTDQELDRAVEAVVNLKSMRGTSAGFRPVLRAGMPKWMGKQEKHFVGREDKLGQLDRAWQDHQPKIVCVVADGGIGKSTLVSEWLDRLLEKGNGEWENVGVVQGFSFSFYKQGAEKESAISPDQFFRDAWQLFSGTRESELPSSEDLWPKLAALCAERRTLLVLDGLEPNQVPRGLPNEGLVISGPLRSFLGQLAEHMNGLCIITTRVFPRQFYDRLGAGGAVQRIDLPPLTNDEAIELVRHYHPGCSTERADGITRACGGHALLLTLICSNIELGTNLGTAADCVRAWIHADVQENAELSGSITEKLRLFFGSLQQELSNAGRETLNAICLFDNEVKAPELDLLLSGEPIAGLSVSTGAGGRWFPAPPRYEILRKALLELQTRSLISARTAALTEEDFELTLLPGAVVGSKVECYDTHPLIRSVVQQGFRQTQRAPWELAHRRLFWRKNAFRPFQPEKRGELLRVYSSVGHGVNCRQGLMAGWLYAMRCLRGFRGYSTNHHGMIQHDRDALSHYYEGHWGNHKENIGLNAYATVQSYVWSGVLLCGTNDYEMGRKLIEEGYARALKHRNSLTAARIMRSLALIGMMKGFLDDALLYARQARQALNLRRKISYWCMESLLRVNKRFQTMSVLLTLGRVHFYQGEFDQANDYFEQAEQIQAGTFKNYPTLKGLWCLWHCDFLLARGRIDEALRRARQALIDPEEPKGWGEGVFAAPAANLALANCLIAQAENAPAPVDLEELRKPLNEAWNGIAHRGKTEWLKPGWYIATAAVHRLAGEFDKADASLKEAEQLVEGQSLVIFTPDISCERARIHLAAGKPALAAELLTSAIANCRERKILGKIDNLSNLLTQAGAVPVQSKG